MKQIKFGYSNDIDPKGSHEGMGIKPGVFLTEANYYGAVEYDGNSYIVAKVVEDKYNRYPHLVGKFIVRDAIADMYADGSGCLFLNQEQSLTAQQLENHLNSENIKNRITTANDILIFCNGVHKANKMFTLLEMDTYFSATSILPEAFEQKNEALKNCHKSFSELQRSLSGTKQY